MFSLNKTAVAVLILANSSAFAGAMGPVCVPGDVTVPCEHSAWVFGATALYLQPIYDAGYGYFGNTVTPEGVRFSDYKGQSSWGFKLALGYEFNTGNDLNVNWSHLDTDTDTIPGSSLAFASNSILSGDTQWDAFNAELGQHVDVSANKKIRFHGGAQYAQLKSHLTHFVNGSYASNWNSEFSGIGARIGMDMNYLFANGLSVYAKGATALLVGPGGFYINCADCGVSYGSKNVIVPEFEAKLGAAYSYATAKGNLTLDAGYMWFDYMKSIHSVNALPLPETSGGTNQTGFSAAGPYVGLTYAGNL